MSWHTWAAFQVCKGWKIRAWRSLEYHSGTHLLEHGPMLAHGCQCICGNHAAGGDGGQADAGKGRIAGAEASL
jgi:hypothetical protein